MKIVDWLATMVAKMLAYALLAPLKKLWLIRERKRNEKATMGRE